MPRLLLAALAACALLACSGGSGNSTPTVDFDVLARQLAPDVPLTLTGLPAGWEESMVDLPADVQLSAECDIFDLDVTFPDAAATA